jgi:hypothetical protein
MKRIKAAAIQIAPDLTSCNGTVDGVWDPIDRAPAPGVAQAGFTHTVIT